ncbi:MAG TPA: hypothetical protein PLF61_07220, partial [Candidatus Goldiibacteriota bacterium]|nr:hypothetical protein [Candidatus Goldiibacteriota bacterium]
NIKNQEDMLTGVPGMVYMFASMFFIFLIFLLEADVIKVYYISQIVKTKTFYVRNYFINFALIILFSFLFSFIPLVAGIKKLEKVEI